MWRSTFATSKSFFAFLYFAIACPLPACSLIKTLSRLGRAASAGVSHMLGETFGKQCLHFSHPTMAMFEQFEFQRDAPRLPLVPSAEAFECDNGEPVAPRR